MGIAEVGKIDDYVMKPKEAKEAGTSALDTDLDHEILGLS